MKNLLFLICLAPLIANAKLTWNVNQHNRALTNYEVKGELINDGFEHNPISQFNVDGFDVPSGSSLSFWFELPEMEANRFMYSINKVSGPYEWIVNLDKLGKTCGVSISNGGAIIAQSRIECGGATFLSNDIVFNENGVVEILWTHGEKH
ncbi:hypothetical protein [Dongshaea marina]|uniref:hypothetical protein n=1 Tax=Dongshaea marina TaxID=2047966 RepID=UPI000D3EA73C|nr:hypothetical protein [Dongshaea marina]